MHFYIFLYFFTLYAFFKMSYIKIKQKDIHKIWYIYLYLSIYIYIYLSIYLSIYLYLYLHLYICNIYIYIVLYKFLYICSFFILYNFSLFCLFVSFVNISIGLYVTVFYMYLLSLHTLLHFPRLYFSLCIFVYFLLCIFLYFHILGVFVSLTEGKLQSNLN